MQLFPCPFCGLRSENEFHFSAETGKTRPLNTQEVSAEAWAGYLYEQKNEKGVTREIWSHLPCAEMFVLSRDSVSMEVLGAETLRNPSA
jgi:sarcosine oxidase subunit delta